MTDPEPPVQTQGTEGVVFPAEMPAVDPGVVVRNKYGTQLVNPEPLAEPKDYDETNEADVYPARSEDIRRPQDPDDPQDVRFIPTDEQVQDEIDRAVNSGGDVETDDAADAPVEDAPVEPDQNADPNDDLAQYRDA